MSQTILCRASWTPVMCLLEVIRWSCIWVYMDIHEPAHGIGHPRHMLCIYIRTLGNQVSVFMSQPMVQGVLLGFWATCCEVIMLLSFGSSFLTPSCGGFKKNPICNRHYLNVLMLWKYVEDPGGCDGGCVSCSNEKVTPQPHHLKVLAGDHKSTYNI